jgi:hypothetical protein
MLLGGVSSSPLLLTALPPFMLARAAAPLLPPQVTLSPFPMLLLVLLLVPLPSSPCLLSLDSRVVAAVVDDMTGPAAVLRTAPTLLLG